MWLRVAVKFNADKAVVFEFVRFLKQRHWRSVAGFSFLEVRKCYAAVFQFLSNDDGGEAKLALFAVSTLKWSVVFFLKTIVSKDLVSMEFQAGKSLCSEILFFV